MSIAREMHQLPALQRIKRMDNERDRDPVQCGPIGRAEDWKIETAPKTSEL